MVKIININTKTRTIHVSNADSDIKTWRTTESGAHFPIKKGETTKEALDKFVEKKHGITDKYAGAADERDAIIKELRGMPAGKERTAKEQRKKALEKQMVKEGKKNAELREQAETEKHLKESGYTKAVEKQQPAKETSDTKGTMKESATDWYAKKFKTDKKMAPKNGVTFEQLYESLKKGENIYDKMGVDDSIVRERVMSEMADRLGVDYSHVYDLWLNGGEKGSESRKNKQTEYVAFVDKLLKDHTDLDPEFRKMLVDSRKRAKKDIK